MKHEDPEKNAEAIKNIKNIALVLGVIALTLIVASLLPRPVNNFCPTIAVTSGWVWSSRF